MPRLVKGGKWTFGWVVVGPEREVAIPPEAWDEYGFQAGDEAIFTPGSHKSGGFGISTPALMAEASGRMGGVGLHELGRSRFGDGRVGVPPEVSVEPGDRLLTVRGSRYGLGFIAQGPIYEEALKHPELEVFGHFSRSMAEQNNRDLKDNPDDRPKQPSFVAGRSGNQHFDNAH
jgi:hypothetical protein